MQTYLALLRGINVGGKALIKMSELKAALETDGFSEVQTYIQSGNVLFRHSLKDTDKLAELMETSISKHFSMDVRVAVFSHLEWKKIIEAAPSWWGKDNSWKHNLLVLLKPYDMSDAVMAVGELKPDIEAMESGKGVLYQSMSLALFGRTTTGKLASSPIYKQMTVRNFNTATKLLGLLEKLEDSNGR
jgi:uncharacterized protein (DUF1697 family)